MKNSDIIKLIKEHKELFKELGEGPNKKNAKDPFQKYAYDLEIALATKIKENEELKIEVDELRNKLQKILRII